MENPTLDQLHNQSAKLHSRIMGTTHVPTRMKLQTERAKILEQINTLTEKKNSLDQVLYTKKLNDLISENRDFTFFSVNNTRIQIQEDGMVEVTFSPCGHKHKLPLKERLRNPNIAQNERTLFERWVDMLKSNVTYSGGLNCQQCRKAKEKRFAKLRKYDNKPIGRASWTLRKLQ